MQNFILDGHKLLWHQERIESWLNGERIAPITIDCALTRKCTYKCQYCFGQLQNNAETLLTKDIIFRFLDDIAEIGVKGVSFVSDGESTCSKHLHDAITRAKKNGLDVALGTNGYLLHDNQLEEILPKLTYLRFNISAVTPDSYAKIMGCDPSCFHKVVNTIQKCVEIKKRLNLDVTLGTQMVLMPQFSEQIIPFSEFSKGIGVDYGIIKHCSDDALGSLGIDYQQYFSLIDLLKNAEEFSTQDFLLKVKWSKLLSEGKRTYSQCYGPPFILQLSGSGLVAPCGGLFHDRYKDFHIGNIAEKSFKEIWKSDRYWEIMHRIASKEFDAQKMCGTLCLQHLTNEFLNNLINKRVSLEPPEGKAPQHINFI